jgi:hypothetical protein
LAKQIGSEDLLPAGDIHNMLGGAEVVWLTERTDLGVTPAETARSMNGAGS